jgi:hypothetical protein
MSSSGSVSSLSSIGVAISGVSSGIILFITTGFILSFVGIGPFQRSNPGGCPLPPVPVRLAFMSFVFSFISSFTQVIERSSMNASVVFCNSATRVVIVSYILAKMSTVGFLGARAAIVYEFGPSQSIKCVSRKLVLGLTVIFELGFGLTLGFTLFDQKTSVDMSFLSQTGICFTAIPILTNIALNFVDALSSILFLLLFVLPQVEIIRNAKKDFEQTHSVVLTERTEKMEQLVGDNLLVGGIASALALICSIAVTLIESADIKDTIPILGASLRQMDLLVNCLTQVYGIRAYFSLKQEWRKLSFKKKTTETDSAHLSKKLLSIQEK